MKLPDLSKNWREYLRKILRYSAIVIAIYFALDMGWFQPLNRYRGIAESKATALGAIAVTEYPEQYVSQYYYAPARLELPERPAGSDDKDKLELAPIGRKMITSASLDLIADNPSDALRAVQALTQKLGGYVVKSQISNAQYASIQIRVPESGFEEAREQLRRLSKRTLSEETVSEDVTKQYVDTDATLKNYRSEEARYREILTHATSVKDIIEVTAKLGEVRRSIEKYEAEFRALSLQTATCLISVSIRNESDVKILGIEWQPGFELKMSVRSGIESVAQYGFAMLRFVMHLPAILLWIATILVGLALGWRVMRWGFRIAFQEKSS